MAQTGGTRKPRAAPRRRAKVAERIVDETIAVAEEVGWDGVRLRTVAERLDVSLADVLEHYRDLDAVADAWFRRAWAAMLAPVPEGFAAVPARERIHLIMMRWFDALAAHRRLAGEILRAKAYPEHPHHWVPLIFNLSRTIQWVRDIAVLDAGSPRRQVEEIGLTGLFLATLAVWLCDDSPGQSRTRDFLGRRLAGADRLMGAVWRGAPAD
ncbi:MAG: TetR/AcrR family transcriptional regulator [Alphaproteobacteria bacterium]